MGQQHFPHLFSPLNIGGVTVKNRIALAPMATSLCTNEGFVTPPLVDYYAARARGGAGLIITENIGVDFPIGMAAANRPTIESELAMPGLRRWTRAIHDNGALAMVQLNHSGRKAKSKVSGFQPVAPSAIAFTGGSAPDGEVPREITVPEIEHVVELFAKAAKRSKRAGFDGIEVHSAHGYLLDQFLSPHSNQRQDRYGGSLENRARFLMEVLDAIRREVGKDFPICCRIGGEERGINDGFTLEDARRLTLILNKVVDLIHVTVWGYGKDALAYFVDEPGALLPLAYEIKKVATVPVMAVGRLTPSVSEQAISDGKTDMVAIGRGLIADPDMPNKALSGHMEDIRPCIACFYCQDHAFLAAHALSCSVNADVGKEKENEIKPAKKSRKIAIIGAGPAGLEAARVLALRGHKVTLLEKEDHLGGQVKLATVPPHKKERIEPLITYYQTQLDKLSVDVRLNTNATVETIEKLAPDVVILASGSQPIIPKVPGTDQDNVVTALDVLAGKAKTGKKVAIIGGGAIGCETAASLQKQGKQVTVVEMLPTLACDMGFRDRMRLLNQLDGLPIDFLTGVKCTGIGKNSVAVVDKKGEDRTINADTIVLAVGLKPSNKLFGALKDRGFEAYLAGDSWHIGKIAGAVEDGSRLGHLL